MCLFVLQINEVQSLIEHLHIKVRIDNNTHTVLSPQNATRAPLFHGLPKIHKPDCPLRSKFLSQ